MCGVFIENVDVPQGMLVGVTVVNKNDIPIQYIWKGRARQVRRSAVARGQNRNDYGMGDQAAFPPQS